MKAPAAPLCCAREGARAVARPMPPILLRAALLLAGPAISWSAMSAEVHVLATTALRPAFEELAPVFEQETGRRLKFEWGPSQGPGEDTVLSRLSRGTRPDAIAITGEAMDAATTEGFVDRNARVDVALSKVAIASGPNRRLPAIHTMSDLEAILEGADHIAISTGLSGRRITEMLVSRGLWLTVKHKVIYVEAPRLVGEALLAGEAAIGFQQMSELMMVPGIQIGGQLPISMMAPSTISLSLVKFERSREEGADWIRFVCRPTSLEVLQRRGFEPTTDCL